MTLRRIHTRFLKFALVILFLLSFLAATTFWFLHREEVDPTVKVQVLDINKVDALCFNPVNHSLAVVLDKDVAIYDPESWQQLHVLSGQGDVIKSLAYSPNGQLLISGGYNGGVILWDVKRNVKLTNIQEGVIDPPGHYLDTSRTINSLTFAPNGAIIAGGVVNHVSPHYVRGKILVWEVATGKQIHVLEEHDSGVSAVAFSPDGDILVSADKTGHLILWDTKTWSIIRKVKHGSEILCTTYQPKANGKIIALSGGWTQKQFSATLWDLTENTFREIPGGEITGHGIYVSCLAFTPDGKTIAVGELSPTHPRHRIQLWSLPSGSLIKTIKCPTEVNAVAISADGRQLAAGCGNGSPSTGKIVICNLSEVFVGD
jgi:WD40 repeat protein